MTARHDNNAISSLISEEKPYRAAVLAAILQRIGDDLSAVEAAVSLLDGAGSVAPDSVQAALFDDFLTCAAVAELATPSAAGSFQGYVDGGSSGPSGDSVWTLDIDGSDAAMVASMFTDKLALVLSDQALGAFVSAEQLAQFTDTPAILEGMLRVGSDDGALPSGARFVFGFSSTRNDTLDDVATRAWFRCEDGNALSWESDDGTTTNAMVSCGVSMPTDGSYTRLKIVMDADGLTFFVNGTEVGSTTDFAPNGVISLRIIAEIQKDGGTAAVRSQIDWIWLRTPRQSAVTLPLYM